MNQHPTLDEAAQAELAAFAAEEATRLGLDRAQWVEPIHTTFTASQRAHTTLWVSGLSLAHDELVAYSLRGLGYRVEPLSVPDQAALQVGKEFGTRGQCNPTWFTVGNLVKKLIELRDVEGIPTEQIISSYVFLTAGACGPCRFGSYSTEYRKALRDAGFDGFRVLLFQQQGGVKQATGEELGLKVDARFALSLVNAMITGDVINLIGYRMRPYELEAGATDRALERCKALVGQALQEQGSVLKALWRCRGILGEIELDRSQVKPMVSVIGEFWAMTTEGDGNYHLQRFLEQEGAEVDVQGVTNWLLFMVWENRYDAEKRQTLREDDGSRRGMQGQNVTKKLWSLTAADLAIRAVFQTYANLIGLHGYVLPDMEDVAEKAAKHYNNNVRGGEGHMEVGKLIHFVEDHVNHLTVSVKPFGCMPSSSVSDGVQTFITARWPGALFLPLETTGDSATNAQSRVQMMLFKAREAAEADFEAALAKTGLTREGFRERLKRSRFGKGPFWRAKHKVAGTAANLVYAVG